MKFLAAASLLQLLLIYVARSSVESAVGLYGPDRYEGLPETCLMPMDFGYCRAKIQRYYFDIRRMKCTMFYWGGCAGNDNNFKSMDECNDYCYTAYEDTNSIAPAKRERSENIASSNANSNTNAKFNSLNSRGSSISKTAQPPKFTVKGTSTRGETSNGTVRASAKSFNVNPTPKQLKYPSPSSSATADDFEEDDEEYVE